MTVAPLLYVARITLEATTAFLIGSGGGDDLWDTAWVADGNGLPTLPGSSLAGVLRAELQRKLMVENANGVDRLVEDIFGWAGSEGEGGRGSRLSVSAGAIHSARNRPVTGLLDPATLREDPVLAHAIAGVGRDHVRLDHQGVALEQAKFDERAVGAGHRFTFELELTGSGDDREIWNQLLAICSGERLYLGGKTRRGMGAFTPVAVASRCFDLRDKADLDAFASHTVDLAEGSDVLSAVPKESAAGNLAPALRVLELGLRSCGPWAIGKGDSESGVDFAPVMESIILWDGEDGAGRPSEPRCLLPGSALKGPIAHRALFHANAVRLRAVADDGERNVLRGQLLEMADRREANPEAKALFGHVSEGANSGDASRGKVYIDDIYLLDAPSRTVLMHVSVDRFTGGARDGLLFDEEVLGNAEFTLVVRAEPDLPEDAVAALEASLADLAGGRLALGGGRGRGNGVFEGTRGIVGDGRFEWQGPAWTWQEDAR